MDPKLSTSAAIGEAEDCPAGPRAPQEKDCTKREVDVSNPPTFPQLTAPEAGPMREQPKRYDLITNYRAGGSIEEMEPSDDGEWVRWEFLLAATDSLRLEHAAWDKRRCEELTSLRLAVERLTETNQRLNRRCQVADAAVQTKCEDFDKRSAKGLRNFYFQRNKELEAEVTRLTQEAKENHLDLRLAQLDAQEFGERAEREWTRANTAEDKLEATHQALHQLVAEIRGFAAERLDYKGDQAEVEGWADRFAALLPAGGPTK